MVSNEEFMAFNQYSAQLNAVTNQKNQLKLLIENLKQTVEELEKDSAKEAYKNFGNVLIKMDKETIIKDIKNELETLDVRIKALEKQEELLTKKLDELKAKIESELKKEEAKK